MVFIDQNLSINLSLAIVANEAYYSPYHFHRIFTAIIGEPLNTYINRKRIEKAALSTKGVKYAVWNVKSHDLSLIFDERKVDLKAIKQRVAKVGHDTKEIKATTEDYDNLHPCCKYREEEVREDHKK